MINLKINSQTVKIKFLAFLNKIFPLTVRVYTYNFLPRLYLRQFRWKIILGYVTISSIWNLFKVKCDFATALCTCTSRCNTFFNPTIVIVWHFTKNPLTLILGKMCDFRPHIFWFSNYTFLKLLATHLKTPAPTWHFLFLLLHEVKRAIFKS